MAKHHMHKPTTTRPGGPKLGSKVTLKPAVPGQKPITFKAGGLHQSTGTPMGQPIPAAKKAKALAGGFGPKAKKQAQFAKNVLKGK
jgi:hypothetical protein